MENESMNNYKVIEHFLSVNGEGPKCGQLAIFIRLWGCNLRCAYCDTAWSYDKDAAYTSMTKEEIYQTIKDYNVKNVTLTGGEPLLADDIAELLEYLSLDSEIEVEIETNGSIDLEPFAKIANPPSFTMDYKLSFSGMESFMNVNNFSLLKKNDTVKFVTASDKDLDIARKMIEEHHLIGKCNVFISPVFGEIDPAHIVDYMKEYNMNGVNLQIQIHKVIWDPQLRGV